MKLGYRVFIVEGNAVRRISQKTFDAFYSGETAALPEYAGGSVLIALVIYELEHRKPKRIVRIDTQRIKVQSDGFIDEEDRMENLRLALNSVVLEGALSAASRWDSSEVIDATARFEERRWQQRHPELSGPALKALLKALFGARHRD